MTKVARKESSPEYRALVIQIASWAMRQHASHYIPIAQTMEQLKSDVLDATETIA